MSPTRPLTGALVLAALSGAVTAPAAHADLTLVQTTTISNPQITAALQSMTPQQRAQVQKSGSPFFRTGPQVVTIYTHGKQSRLDYGGYTFIADQAKGQVLTLNRRMHTYSSRPLGQAQGGGVSGATVRDLHQSKTILGHVAHHYMVSTANVGGAGSQLKADVWAAASLAQPSSSLTGGGPTGPLQSLLRQVQRPAPADHRGDCGQPCGHCHRQINRQVTFDRAGRLFCVCAAGGIQTGSHRWRRLAVRRRSGAVTPSSIGW